MENRLLGTYFPTYFLNFKFYLPQDKFKYWITPLFKVGIYFLKCNLQTLLQTFQERLFANKISQHFEKNVIASLSSDWGVAPLGHGSSGAWLPGGMAPKGFGSAEPGAGPW